MAALPSSPRSESLAAGRGRGENPPNPARANRHTRVGVGKGLGPGTASVGVSSLAGTTPAHFRALLTADAYQTMNLTPALLLVLFTAGGVSAQGRQPVCSFDVPHD